MSVAELCITRRQGAAVLDWSATSAHYLMPRRSGQADAWTEEAANAGRVGTQKILEVGEHPLPPDIQAALGTAHTSAILRRRIVLADGIPVEVVDSWWPLSVAAGTPLAEKRKIPGGAQTVLANLGYVPLRVVEEAAAARPADAHGDLLGLNPFDRVLELTRVQHGVDDLPFEVTVMAMTPELPDGALRRLRYELALD